ncbi:hypothetical protein [Embleya sp. NPDC020630]|uniref:hypothetical protein n=1 Tax=Embleya sp. NPDC020630 TaxID=3363979 RepID=UPI00379434E7
MTQAVEFGPNGGPQSIGDAVATFQPIVSAVSKRLDKARSFLKNKRKAHYKPITAAARRVATNTVDRARTAKLYAQNSGMRAGARAYRKFENQARKGDSNQAKARMQASRSRAQIMLLQDIAAGNTRRFAPGLQRSSAARRQAAAARKAVRSRQKSAAARRRAAGFAADAAPARERLQELMPHGRVPERAREAFNL